MTIHTFPAAPAFEKTRAYTRQEMVAAIITDLTTSLIQGVIPDAQFLATQLDGQDHADIRAWIKKNAHMLEFTVKDYERELRLARIRADLGGVPQYAEELVQLAVARDRMTCLYNGQITKDGLKIIEGQVVGRADLAIPTIAEKVHFSCPAKVNLDALMRQLRMISDKHRLGFTDRAINDAVIEWVEVARRERRFDLYMTLGGPLPNIPQREEAERLWLDVAQRLFVTSEDMPVPFVVAVLKKFMHQVKRKLRSLPVYDHLMPVILGTQGKGKSTFVRAMLNPIKELMLGVDFKMIEDDRNIDIWASYVLFIDEMGYASKANIDTIKNAITAETLTRKPLYTNAKVEIEQNATFIGCSNKTLEQLIKDPTGIRRFVALQYHNDPDWEFLNALNWTQLWRSVDHEGPCPMAPFKLELAEVQEGSREMGRVEHWLTDFDPVRAPDFGSDGRGRVKAKLLYDNFREFEDSYYPGPHKTSLTEWGHEMRRMEQAGQNTRFRHLGKVSGNVQYEFLG
ncbi:VapE domain-containing protein [Methylobacterium phyllosphaerae]